MNKGLHTDLFVPEQLQLLSKNLHTVCSGQQRMMQLLVPSHVSQNSIGMSQKVHMGLAAVATMHASDDVPNASCFCTQMTTYDTCIMLSKVHTA